MLHNQRSEDQASIRWRISGGSRRARTGRPSYIWGTSRIEMAISKPRSIILYVTGEIKTLNLFLKKKNHFNISVDFTGLSGKSLLQHAPLTFTLFVLLGTFPNRIRSLKELSFLEKKKNIFFWAFIIISPSIVDGGDSVCSRLHGRPAGSGIWALWHNSLPQHHALPRPGQYLRARTSNPTRVMVMA